MASQFSVLERINTISKILKRHVVSSLSMSSMCVNAHRRGRHWAQFDPRTSGDILVQACKKSGVSFVCALYEVIVSTSIPARY